MEGPTLEIFSYDVLADSGEKAVNRPGFAHIAFQVEDVPAARQEVLAAGGKPVGEVVMTSNCRWPAGNLVLYNRPGRECD